MRTVWVNLLINCLVLYAAIIIFMLLFVTCVDFGKWCLKIIPDSTVYSNTSLGQHQRNQSVLAPYIYNYTTVKDIHNCIIHNFSELWITISLNIYNWPDKGYTQLKDLLVFGFPYSLRFLQLPTSNFRVALCFISSYSMMGLVFSEHVWLWLAIDVLPNCTRHNVMA